MKDKNYRLLWIDYRIRIMKARDEMGNINLIKKLEREKRKIEGQMNDSTM